jgi:dimethylglycine dehydrogenase
VPTFSTSWSIMNMQRYSTELYRGLGAGGRLRDELPRHRVDPARAIPKERMQEFARARGMGLYQGMNLEILSPDEIKDKYPFIETHDLKGALYDRPMATSTRAQLTQALAKGARDSARRSCASAPPPASAAKTASGSSIPKRATSAARSW